MKRKLKVLFENEKGTGTCLRLFSFKMNYFMDFYGYDHYIVMFSGGKDSTACFLQLLELKVPKHKMELWHHLVDGSGKPLMDWECTEDYCRKFAKAFDVPIYFSWKEDGFEGEMLRENRPIKPNWFESPSGLLKSGGLGKPNTRLLFPQLSNNLAVRWCSSYLKIDVAKTGLINQKRFANRRILVLSGERAQESTARVHYAYWEPDPTDNRSGKRNFRHVDRCRIVHKWNEGQVWELIEKYKVVVHPCYYLGYGRCSCKWCIFGSPSQMATSFYLSPNQGIGLAAYEKQFSKTIRRDKDLLTYIQGDNVYPEALEYRSIAIQAITAEYTLPIFCDNWILPAGAFKSQTH